MYTEEQIKTVIQNVIGSAAKSVTLIGPFTFRVEFERDVTTGEMSHYLDDLYGSDLFDVTYKSTYTFDIKYIGEEVMEFHQYRLMYNILENAQNFITFDDNQIKRLTTLYNFQHIKYHQGFFKSIFDKLVKDKKLTKKQYDEFKFLLDNGRSKYEAGLLSTKN